MRIYRITKNLTKNGKTLTKLRELRKYKNQIKSIAYLNSIVYLYITEWLYFSFLSTSVNFCISATSVHLFLVVFTNFGASVIPFLE